MFFSTPPSSLTCVNKLVHLSCIGEQSSRKYEDKDFPHATNQAGQNVFSFVFCERCCGDVDLL